MCIVCVLKDNGLYMKSRTVLPLKHTVLPLKCTGVLRCTQFLGEMRLTLVMCLVHLSPVSCLLSTVSE